jgi:hypothetical protein
VVSSRLGSGCSLPTHELVDGEIIGYDQYAEEVDATNGTGKPRSAYPRIWTNRKPMGNENRGLDIPRASRELEGLGREGREDGGVPRTLGGEGDRVVLVSAVLALLSFACPPSAGAADFIVDHKPVMVSACLTCESNNHQ